MKERREAREPAKERTLDDAAEAFFADRRDGARPLKPRSLAEYERQYRVNIGPALGSRTLTSLTPTDADRLHKGAGGKAIGNRLLALLGSVWGWSAKHPREWVEAHKSPNRAVQKHAEVKKERFLDEAELGRLLDALDQGEGEGLAPWRKARDLPEGRAKHRPKTRITVMSPHVTGAIRLLLLTGARLNEILSLRWSEIDVDRGMAFLPDSKTGKKALPLNTEALAEIERLRTIRENDFVVGGGSGGKPRADLRKPWSAITTAAGLDGLRLHDLRHSAASFALASGHSLSSIGGILGHKQVATTARYAHLSAGPVRAAAQAIGDTISAARARSGRAKE